MDAITNPIEQLTKGPSTKKSYGFVNTKELLKVFESHGWKPISQHIANARKLENKGFQKHLISLGHPNYLSIPGLTDANESRIQLCVLNSHDGTAALRLFIGALRIACLNGIIAGTNIRSFRAVHSQSIIDKLNHGIKYMTEGIDEAISSIQKLQSKRFDEQGLDSLIHCLVDARLKNVQNIVNINYESALRIKRTQDNATDAFTVFNRIQESLMRGGIEYSYTQWYEPGLGLPKLPRTVTTHTRELASIPSQLKLNQLAWDTALRLAA